MGSGAEHRHDRSQSELPEDSDELRPGAPQRDVVVPRPGLLPGATAYLLTTLPPGQRNGGVPDHPGQGRRAVQQTLSSCTHSAQIGTDQVRSRSSPWSYRHTRAQCGQRSGMLVGRHRRRCGQLVRPCWRDAAIAPTLSLPVDSVDLP